jgi:hypothetical protein
VNGIHEVRGSIPLASMARRSVGTRRPAPSDAVAAVLPPR